MMRMEPGSLPKLFGAVEGDRRGTRKSWVEIGVGSGRSWLGPMAIAGGGRDSGGRGGRSLVVQLDSAGGVLGESTGPRRCSARGGVGGHAGSGESWEAGADLPEGDSSDDTGSFQEGQES